MTRFQRLDYGACYYRGQPSLYPSYVYPETTGPSVYLQHWAERRYFRPNDEAMAMIQLYRLLYRDFHPRLLRRQQQKVFACHAYFQAVPPAWLGRFLQDVPAPLVLTGGADKGWDMESA